MLLSSFHNLLFHDDMNLNIIHLLGCLSTIIAWMTFDDWVDEAIIHSMNAGL